MDDKLDIHNICINHCSFQMTGYYGNIQTLCCIFLCNTVTDITNFVTFILNFVTFIKKFDIHFKWQQKPDLMAYDFCDIPINSGTTF